MKQTSAGLLMFRKREGKIQFLLVHPGGPFFAKKDAGIWSIPKGLVEEGEDLLETAKREFQEETGIVPDGKYVSLGSIDRKDGKTIHAWGFEADCDPTTIKSNMFEMDWPPRSGKKQSFPEVDRGGFFEIDEAKTKIQDAQIPFLERLIEAVS